MNTDEARDLIDAGRFETRERIDGAADRLYRELTGAPPLLVFHDGSVRGGFSTFICALCVAVPATLYGLACLWRVIMGVGQ